MTLLSLKYYVLLIGASENRDAESSAVLIVVQHINAKPRARNMADTRAYNTVVACFEPYCAHFSPGHASPRSWLSRT